MRNTAKSTTSKKLTAAIVIKHLHHSSESTRDALTQTRLLDHLGYDISWIYETGNTSLFTSIAPVRTIPASSSSLLKSFFGSNFTRNADKICEKEKFDLIFGHGDHFHQHILSLHHLPHLESEWLTGHPLPASDERGKIQAEILKKSNYKLLLVDSQLMKKDLTERFQIDPLKVEVSYPTYNRDIFNTKNKATSRSEARPEFGLSEEDLVMGLFAQHSFEAQGLDYALKVFSKLTHSQPLRFLAVGPEKDISEYKKTAEDLSLSERVIFMSHNSFLDSPQKRSGFYHALDIYFSPARIESFGTSVLEAMACGLPILTSLHVGAAEVLLAKQLIKAPDDESGWLEGLTELINNSDWRKSISRQNAERALLLDESHHAKRLLDILQKYELASL